MQDIFSLVNSEFRHRVRAGHIVNLVEKGFFILRPKISMYGMCTIVYSCTLWLCGYYDDGKVPW